MKRMRRRPCPVTISTYRRARAKARHVLEEEKTNGKRELVSSINSGTSQREAWKKIKTFTGNAPTFNYPITRDNIPIIGDKAKAEEFARTFREGTLGDHSETGT